ncbi:MAG: DUF4159 domain-containing protein [Planctomycetes bacterium]|nr:DUF4159 domain-containing protein [Planctomycetota bacterium]
MTRKNALLTAVVAAAVLLTALPARSEEDICEDLKKFQAQRGKPQRWSGGESFPPLPLPVTPLRRSEKKRQPAPPVLVGKVAYGEIIETRLPNGSVKRERDWITDPNDIHNLMKEVNNRLGIRYKAQEMSLDSFSFDPAEVPILYLTGCKAVSLDDDTRTKLRWYLQSGGVLMCDAVCGSEAYLKGWMNEMNHIFPKRKIRELPADHPIFNCFYKVDRVSYEVDGKKMSGPPKLLGIDIGTRTAVVLTPFDLSLAWGGHYYPRGRHVWPAQDAYKIGVNMISYFLATYRQGRHNAVKVVYHEEDEPDADALAIGQIVHAGNWDPHPNAIANLLKFSAANSTLNVRFKREAVNLASSDLARYPVLYVTGDYDPELDEQELGRLKNYLANGGLLIADGATGGVHFDASFRAALAKMYPGRELSVIPKTSPVFSASGVNVGEFRLRPILAQNTSPDSVNLYGLEANGAYSVIYSPCSIGCGWEGVDAPFTKGFQPETSLLLGMNLLVYALTH